MKNTKAIIKAVGYILCAALIAATVIFAAGCGTEQNETASTIEDGKVYDIGEGKHNFVLEVVDLEGNIQTFNIKSDEESVGSALQDLGLVEGDEGSFGLYVKKVNGITADYDNDGTYWAFYINGEMAPAGIDQTDIEDGTTYRLEVTKG